MVRYKQDSKTIVLLTILNLVTFGSSAASNPLPPPCFAFPYMKQYACAVDDCEVGSTRKACKNCTCGRAEEEQKVEIGLTTEQISNPKSACGSVCLILFFVNINCCVD